MYNQECWLAVSHQLFKFSEAYCVPPIFQRFFRYELDLVANVVR